MFLYQNIAFAVTALCSDIELLPSSPVGLKSLQIEVFFRLYLLEKETWGTKHFLYAVIGNWGLMLVLVDFVL